MRTKPTLPITGAAKQAATGVLCARLVGALNMPALYLPTVIGTDTRVEGVEESG